MFDSQYSKKNSSDEEQFYYSNDGYIIFTEKYHLRRGYCCKNKCKHCPFGFKKKGKNNINDGFI